MEQLKNTYLKIYILLPVGFHIGNLVTGKYLKHSRNSIDEEFDCL